MDVTTGKSVISGDIVYETITSSSKFTIQSGETSTNYITILNNGITKVVDIKDQKISAIKTTIGNNVEICKCKSDGNSDGNCDDDNCVDDDGKLTAGESYKFTFTGSTKYIYYYYYYLVVKY